MADWKETLEPYIKVQESVKTVALNPTAGEDLIIGVVLVSDSGSVTAQLVNGQTEFCDMYASEDITEDYIKGLDKLYEGASQMWENAYRLAGSTTLLVVRAGKSDGVYFAKSLEKNDNSSYVLKGSEILRKVSGGFKLAINENYDLADRDNFGWSISVTGAGVYGNRVTVDGVAVDYDVQNLVDLVEQLNNTEKFLATRYEFYNDTACQETSLVTDITNDAVKNTVKAVVFHEVYVASDFLDCSDTEEDIDSGRPTTAFYDADGVFHNYGTRYLILCEIGSSVGDINQKDLTESFKSQYQGSDVPKWYAINKYNSSSNISIRIRRFNHTAVVNKEIGSQSRLSKDGKSPYEVLNSVLNTLTDDGIGDTPAAMAAYDFYEVAVYDPKMSEEVMFFNIGNVPAKGDMTIEELNEMLPMIYLELPTDMSELGLNYYGYKPDNKNAVEVTDTNRINAYENADLAVTEAKAAATSENPNTEAINAATREREAIAITKKANELKAAFLESPVGTYLYDSTNRKMYVIEADNEDSMFVSLGVDNSSVSLIKVDTSDLVKALDEISNNEIYSVEGLCDLGNTDRMFQNALRNLAINEKFFYPVSTLNSTNYLTIANGVSKISQDSPKLYCSAPWDIDTGTLGWKFYASPSVIYWEAVSKNRRNNEEFRPLFGQLSIGYQSPTVEFNRKTRQLLLSKKINTAMWDTQTQSWNMNDNVTKQTEDNILSDESNVRLGIRIAKAMPVILRQYLGKKISERLCKNVEDTINYWINNNIMPLEYGPEATRVSCKYDAALARKNKIKVVVSVRFYRALKYIDVYNEYYDTGMEFVGE